MQVYHMRARFSNLKEYLIKPAQEFPDYRPLAFPRRLDILAGKRALHIEILYNFIVAMAK